MDEMSLLLREPKVRARARKVAPRSFVLPWSKVMLYRFSTSLARLLEGGVSLLRALEVVNAGESRTRAHRDTCALIQSIRDGVSFSESAKKLKIFPDYFIQMLEVGEATGKLPEVLARMSIFLERQIERTQKIREALTYPLFLIFTGFVSVFILVQKVLPKIMTVYSDFEGTLPLLTRWILTLSALFPWIMAGTVLFTVSVGFFLMKNRGAFFDGALHVPGLKKLVHAILFIRFASMCSLLLSNGVPILKTFSLMKKVSLGNQFHQDMESVERKVSGGASLSEALRKCCWVSEEMSALMAAGEESGRLGECFEQVVRDGEKTLDSQTKFCLKLIEPTLILFLGVFVSLLVMGALLPVFEINSLLR